MADIPGFPALNITDEHKSQAEALLEAIKKDNPDHADFSIIWGNASRREPKAPCFFRSFC